MVSYVSLTIPHDISPIWFMIRILILNPGVPGSVLGGTAIPGSTASTGADRFKPGGNAVHLCNHEYACV